MQSEQRSGRNQRKLITARDVDRMPLGGVLPLDDQAIVTPHARDRARARGVQFRATEVAVTAIPEAVQEPTPATTCSCGTGARSSGLRRAPRFDVFANLVRR